MRLDGMDDLRAIGQVARLSGLSVPTVRFYSDAGLVPVAARTAGGHRLYDRDALHRLELIRTLRELGVDLATVARVLASEHTVAEVADREAVALERQIHDLRVRQAVLRYAAARGTDADGLVRAGRLARLTGEQRRALVAGLVAEATAGLELEPGFAARLRSLLPEPPDDPERIGAWVELAHLVSDPDFRSAVRRSLERHAADRAAGADGGNPGGWQRAEEAVVELAGGALSDGLSPASAEARPIADRLVAVFAEAHRRHDDEEFRAWLAERIRIGADARVARYLRLLAVINGAPVRTDSVPAARWFLAALESSGRRRLPVTPAVGG
ncbi:MerR family transcriptional regulator [Actinoallomurus oryzae]|uniref:MerR family transcriptional regulator n=1 Tax=Actinoallomurus oryzae TaxID=502180 RepID=A0ABP8PN52_9ACTN